jgi:3-deoxy-D-manno-octulosonate 8-phosphate phosphatase (KDO 8-P phosphatase)
MFREFGVGLAPANACAEVMAAADWVASVRGGDGAVREAAELILKAQDAWQPLLKKFDYA